MSDRWYVVNTKNKLENFAADNLSDQGFPTFYPKYIKTIERHGRSMKLVVPFYPSYIFVRFNLDTDPWRRIFGTRGVNQLVCAQEDSVLAVPIGFVEDLILSCDADGYIPVETGVGIMETYVPGEELEVKDGPFAGMKGICEKSDGDRVRIFLSLLSRETAVSLSVSSISRDNPIGGSASQ